MGSPATLGRNAHNISGEASSSALDLLMATRSTDGPKTRQDEGLSPTIPTTNR